MQQNEYGDEMREVGYPAPYQSANVLPSKVLLKLDLTKQTEEVHGGQLSTGFRPITSLTVSISVILISGMLPRKP